MEASNILDLPSFLLRQRCCAFLSAAFAVSQFLISHSFIFIEFQTFLNFSWSCLLRPTCHTCCLISSVFMFSDRLCYWFLVQFHCLLRTDIVSFPCFKFVKVCFITQNVVYLVEYSVWIWGESVSFSYGLKSSTDSNLQPLDGRCCSTRPCLYWFSAS